MASSSSASVSSGVLPGRTPPFPALNFTTGPRLSAPENFTRAYVRVPPAPYIVTQLPVYTGYTPSPPQIPLADGHWTSRARLARDVPTEICS